MLKTVYGNTIKAGIRYSLLKSFYHACMWERVLLNDPIKNKRKVKTESLTIHKAEFTRCCSFFLRNRSSKILPDIAFWRKLFK